MKRKRPYKLSDRLPLTATPPFTVDLVRSVLVEALVGPKGRITRSEPDVAAIEFLTNVLNARHRYFYVAQQERGRAEGRDQAATLVQRLRQILPKIAKDADAQQEKTDDFFARNTARAVRLFNEFLRSDIPTTALWPLDLPENVFGWQWVAPSLFADLEPLIGANAAVRFIGAIMPRLSGEAPKCDSVKKWLQHNKSAA